MHRNITDYLSFTYGMSVSIFNIVSVLSITPFLIILVPPFRSLKSINISSDLARLVFWNDPNNIYTL